MRKTRPKYSELNAEQKKKSNARSYANVYQRKGLLKPQPCEECGAADAQKHHHDYDKPLHVRWLCRKCHEEMHVIVWEKPQTDTQNGHSGNGTDVSRETN